MDVLAKEIDSIFSNNTYQVKRIFSHLGQNSAVAQDAVNANKVVSTAYIAAGIKHQFGNYYSVGELLLSDIVETLNEGRSKEALKLLEMMSNLFDSLKHLTKIDSEGSWDCKNSTQKISQALMRVKVLLSVIAKRKGVALSLKMEHDARVTLDQFHFEQVIVNLCRNAEQALMQESGVNREISIFTHQVDEYDQKKFPELCLRDYIGVTVKNDGKGMSNEVFNHIGTPEFTTKLKGEGSGLGLNVCAHLIERHGGVFIARNKEGVGVGFTAYLPTDVS